MQANMRRNLPGQFLARDLGGGAWSLSREGPAALEILLLGAPPDAADIFRSAPLCDVDIEWGAGVAVLRLTCAARRATIEARNAIVHEPLPRLYEALPLPHIDAKARRFWANVFRLVRIPGGRHLLGVFTRRSHRRP